jgi:hypothetical protein
MSVEKLLAALHGPACIHTLATSLQVGSSFRGKPVSWPDKRHSTAVPETTQLITNQHLATRNLATDGLSKCWCRRVPALL